MPTRRLVTTKNNRNLVSEVVDFLYQIIDFLMKFGDLVSQFNLGVIAHNVLRLLGCSW